MLSEHHLPEVFDPSRILTDQQRCEIFERAGDGARVPLERGLAPAEQAGLISLDLDEDPVAHARMADQWGNGGYLHGKAAAWQG